MTATKVTAPPKPWRSGWCGLGNPPASHDRCAVFAPGTGTPCVCSCHTTSGPEDMPTVEVTRACSCWAGPPSLHEGHCCFRDYPPEPYDGPVQCGHDVEGMALFHASRRIL